MQLQKRLIETGQMYTTLRNSTAVYQCAMSMEAMQDYDK